MSAMCTRFDAIPLLALTALAPLAALPACGDRSAEGTTPSDDRGSVGLGQGGAQDFGLFRQIVADGGIPAPDTLDDVGFFAEHKLDYPPADCGQDVCVHALGGAGDNLITGATCTVLQIGLNTPIDPATLPRPPLDLVVALDVSGSMAGRSLDAVKAGLVRMLDHLDAADRVTLVAYSDVATVVARAVDPVAGHDHLEIAITDLVAGGATDIYGGLFTAFDLAAKARAPGREARVVLLSDGEATAGLTTPARLRALAAAYAEEGIGLTTIGIGDDFDVDVMRGLAEVGAGNFYFLEDPDAVREVFTEEVATFLHPIALDVDIAFASGPAYVARRVYGTHGFTGGTAGGVVHVPSLFVAGRRSADAPVDPIEGGGRRGGGGTILIELAPLNASTLADLQLADDALADVGTVSISWTDPVTGARHTSSTTVTNPSAHSAPDQRWFTSATVEKGFVMMNLFAGFELAADLAADSDPGAARGVLDALARGVDDWFATHDDDDIAADRETLRQFAVNLAAVAAQTPRPNQ